MIRDFFLLGLRTSQSGQYSSSDLLATVAKIEAPGPAAQLFALGILVGVYGDKTLVDELLEECFETPD